MVRENILPVVAVKKGAFGRRFHHSSIMTFRGKLLFVFSMIASSGVGSVFSAHTQVGEQTARIGGGRRRWNAQPL
jgi:hypothetical protein